MDGPQPKRRKRKPNPPKPRKPKPPPWQLITCPGTVRFARVHKEYQTNARIYALHQAQRPNCVWLGQSITQIWRQAREHAMRFHVNSCYRIIRGQARTNETQGVVVHCVRTAQEVNAILDKVRAPWLCVVLRDPDKWETRDANDDSESETEERSWCEAPDSARLPPGASRA